jgi:Mn2+/Fe2+ NRAMP family transporter
MSKLIELLKLLGPGIIFASLCIGETHIALLAYAGAKYGFALLWMVIMVHLFYYPNYEYGTRYASATGETLIDGYARLKVGRALVWVFFVFLWVTPCILLASLGGLTASVLLAAFPGIKFGIWCIIVWAVSVAIILAGKYKALEGISKILVLVIVAMAILAFFFSPPNLGEFATGFVPGIPAVAGVMIVVVAILRVPTDSAASIFLSEWAQVKRQQWLADAEDSDSKTALLSSLKKAIFDMRVGWVLSCIVAIIYLSLGATVIRPLGIIPEGVEISLKLSEIFTQSIGRWVMPLFLLATFAAFWGGYISVLDGTMRLIKDIWQKLFKSSDRFIKKLGPVYLIIVSTTGLAMATIVKRPMVMVLIAVSLGLIYYPLVMGQNIFLVTRKIDPEFRPSKLNVTIAFIGFALAMISLVLLILVRVLKVIQ